MGRMRLDSIARVLLVTVCTFALLVAVLGSAGCSADASSDGAAVKSADAQGSSDGEADAAEPAKDMTSLAVGEVVTIDGVGIGVKAVEKGPKDWSGDATIRVTVVYENGTDSEISFNVFDWSVENESGVRKDGSLTDKESISSGNLAPGGKLEGDVFLPAKGAAKILYSGNWLFDGEEDKLIWIIE